MSIETNCRHCGTKLDSGERFCKNCGCPVLSQPPYLVEPPPGGPLIETELLQRIKSSIAKSSFDEHMKRLVPKYKGYNQQEDRRETDILVRNKMAEILDRTRSSLIDIMSILMDNGDTKLAQIIKSLQDEVSLFRDQIKNAEYGFDIKTRSVTEEKTSTYDKILKADTTLIIVCTELFENCSELQNKAVSGELNHSDLLEVRKVIQCVKELFYNRRDFITSVSDV